MTATRVSQHINAPRAAVYRALLDPAAVATWMVPSGMTSQVHAFEAHEGGSFRISLTYDTATESGKTTAHSDTYHGRFVVLVRPDGGCHWRSLQRSSRPCHSERSPKAGGEESLVSR
jgi:uncharacterized protein YndB with AHSA1/START domain